MSIYFCLDDLIETIAREDGAFDLEALAPVQTHGPHCGGYFADAMILSSQPKLLNLNTNEGIYDLALLIGEVSSYRKNMEITLDEALAERHSNRMVYKALYQAFEGQPLPNPALKPENSDISEQSLQHMMLSEVEDAALCRIYSSFIRILPAEHDTYSFERRILHHHDMPFRERFDGYISGTGGKIRADLLLGFSVRNDYDPRRPLEQYVENGRARAERMRITEPHEFLWAWLEADHYQMRRCYDIDRILSIKGLPRLPGWLRTDVFNCLEKEAIKQSLAEKLVRQDGSLSLLVDLPKTKMALLDASNGLVDENLQKLLSQTLNPQNGYDGAGKRFHNAAVERATESKRI